MRQIDNMSGEEIETLRLKGMLPPYPKVESTEDFKMRLRVMLGRPAIVSNAPRQKLTNTKYNNENANQGSKTD
jgi:hypothetical protein